MLHVTLSDDIASILSLFNQEGIVNPTKQRKELKDKDIDCVLDTNSGDSLKWALSNTMYQRAIYLLLICVSTSAALKVRYLLSIIRAKPNKYVY